MKTVLVLALLVAVAAARITSGNAEWEAYKQKYGKSYADPVEDSYRLKIYLDRAARVEEHNARHAKGLETFTLAINKFADLTTLEVKEMLNGAKQPEDWKNPKNAKKFVKKVGAVPDTVDWRDEGLVTPVKDQGQCGSCWSFSTTGALEGQWKLSTGDLVSFSEQQLVDCSVKYGNLGCSGGWPYQADEYIEEYGSETEEDYPYYAIDRRCAYDESLVVGHLSDYVSLPYGDEDSLKNAVGTIGPVSICIDASHESFQLYNSGVYYSALCNPDNLDHAVLAVGYGTEGGEDYWLVKNSWGTSWGEEGYIKMARNENNNCGIASAATYPIV